MKTLGIRAIGRLPEPWMQEAVHMYEKRLAPFGGVEVTELTEGHKGSAKPDEEKTRHIEGLALMKGIPNNATVVALDAGGVLLTSEKLAQQIESWTGSGRPLVFLIGGSWGLDDTVLANANFILSLGPMTYPHGLARVMLMEQLYRAKMIAAGREYHK